MLLLMIELDDLLVVLVIFFLGEHEGGELLELSFEILGVLLLLELGEVLTFGLHANNMNITVGMII